MQATITCVKQVGEAKHYYAVSFSEDGSSISEFESREKFQLGDVVEISAEGTAEKVGTEKPEEILEKAGRLADKLLIKTEYASGISAAEPCLKKMWPKLIEASALLLRKLILGAPIIVRFHNDADGSTGAYALYKAIESLSDRVTRPERYNIRWVMNKGVIYSLDDATYDGIILNEFSSLDGHLLFITDFGTSVGSNPGISSITKNADIVWMDHHPPEEGFTGTTLPFYVSPWLFGGDSNITAGFLTTLFSKTIARIDTKEIENASFIGDYSTYADRNAPGADLAMLLDMITSDVRMVVGQNSKNLTPSEIDALFKDKKRYNELVDFARIKMGEALDKGIGLVKKYNAPKGTIYLLDFELLRSEDSRYPLPGRFSSKLLDKLSEQKHTDSVLLLHFGSFISVRVDGKIADLVNMPSVITELQTNFEDMIENAGGHKNAMGIKLTDSKEKKEVLNGLISVIKEHLQ